MRWSGRRIQVRRARLPRRKIRVLVGGLGRKFSAGNVVVLVGGEVLVVPIVVIIRPVIGVRREVSRRGYVAVRAVTYLVSVLVSVQIVRGGFFRQRFDGQGVGGILTVGHSVPTHIGARRLSVEPSPDLL
jgi:hypothetical protein